MDQRLLVDSITKETTDWTCKVQEQQVSIVIYDEDIPRYDNLFLLFHTYLVSCAKVRDPRSYSIRAGTYGWVADKYTIVEPIIDNDGLEAPLPAPEKLSTLLFSAIEQQHPGVEFALRLATRYQTTILPNPQGNYPDELGEAERTNVVIYFSSSTSSLNLAPIEDQVQSVSTIPESLSTVQTVHVEGRISLPDHSQSFYLLGCSHCNQDVRPKTKKNGPLLLLYTTSAIGPQLYLFPFRCHFNIDITDFSGTITTTMSEALAERILSLTANQIYDKVAVQRSREAPPPKSATDSVFSIWNWHYLTHSFLGLLVGFCSPQEDAYFDIGCAPFTVEQQRYRLHRKSPTAALTSNSKSQRLEHYFWGIFVGVSSP
ncbi:hypothetical protein T459_02923 [Capsicum annuum]|uniref:Uncharacterized protein n=1 Tax=Capsicum annuum TaxID=4072 RepID=A0A2G3ALD1_CAPAN|nr:hypothetical protein T459_02923 [Capsicum annuum]